MTTYRITDRDGREVSHVDAPDGLTALDVLARKAGFSDYEDACQQQTWQWTFLTATATEAGPRQTLPTHLQLLEAVRALHLIERTTTNTQDRQIAQSALLTLGEATTGSSPSSAPGPILSSHSSRPRGRGAAASLDMEED